MHIGVISDTHDDYQGIDIAFAYFQQQSIDLVVHAGDWTTPEVVTYVDDLAGFLGINVIGVLGNNDREVHKQLNSNELLLAHSYIPLDDVLETMIDGHILGVYHGHSSQTLSDLVENDIFDVIITGHTHKPKLEAVGKSVVINPGSASFSIPQTKKNNGIIAVVDMSSIDVSFIQLSQL